MARGFHGLAVVSMVWLGAVAGLHAVYYIGVVAIGAMLAYEHFLVRADDLTKVNTAFMTMNSLVSVAYFAFTLADLLLMGDAESSLLLP
jgi:4-hydroxybenzoate polyprenyltransferase